jgi:bifunctional enzyme CysN/CysC
MTALSGAVWQSSKLTRGERWAATGTTGATVWLTGLSGSGKSAIADSVQIKLLAAGRCAYVLDADNVRHGLCADLGFTPENRTENARRIGEVAALLADAGLICLVPIISPYRADRERVRLRHQEVGLTFVEVFVDTPLETCRQRDPKGLYRRAEAGAIPEFTGVTAPYEEPLRPDLHLRTDGCDVDAASDQVVQLIGRCLQELLTKPGDGGDIR